MEICKSNDNKENWIGNNSEIKFYFIDAIPAEVKEVCRSFGSALRTYLELLKLFGIGADNKFPNRFGWLLCDKFSVYLMVVAKWTSKRRQKCREIVF